MKSNMQYAYYPWRRKWQPATVFLPGKFHRQRNLVGYSPRGLKKSDMTEQLTHTRLLPRVLETHTCERDGLETELDRERTSMQASVDPTRMS